MKRAFVSAALALALAACGSSSGGAPALTDKTTCLQWDSATPAQQSDYANLFIQEYGPSSASPGDVVNQIHANCYQAGNHGSYDTTTVVQALNYQF